MEFTICFVWYKELGSGTHPCNTKSDTLRSFPKTQIQYNKTPKYHIFTSPHSGAAVKIVPLQQEEIIKIPIIVFTIKAHLIMKFVSA